MIDHLTLAARDFAQAKAFYAQALAPLGWAVQMEFPDTAGLGPKGKPELWLKPGDPPSTPMHLAFAAPDRPSVDAFYAAALAAGARDNGGPGLRLDYHPDYYAAFVLDPDGHNVEVVCHLPAAAARGARKAPGRKAPAKRAKAGAATRKPAARKAPARAPRGKKRR